MKKIILSLAISAALFSSAVAHAADQKPGMIVKQAFTKEFVQAKDVEWTMLSNNGVYQAKFTFNNESVNAFFSEEGEFLGTTRQILKSQLPIAVAAEMEKRYADARVATIFEYSKKEGVTYYITVINSKGAMVLTATGNGELAIYKKNIQ